MDEEIRMTYIELDDNWSEYRAELLVISTMDLEEPKVSLYDDYFALAVF